MKTKIFTLLILTMIIITTIGYSYSCHNGRFHINCYCYCNIKFTHVTTSDNEIEKDVGDVYATISCDKNIINVYISNAYPCYEANITYTIKNTGCKPVRFTGLTIINDYPEALEITTTNHTCTWLMSGETVQGTTTVHILQEAEQNWQYTFQIRIGTECQKRSPRTIGYWKLRFLIALYKIRHHIPSPTLEQYLDEISAQSQIFEFTGTQKQKFRQALEILKPPRRSSMEAKLKAQLLALWLNYVAGWTEGYKLEGMTAWDIIQGSENALLNNETSEYEYWKNMCDRFNNL